MKKLIHISLVVAFILAFVSCEKEVFLPIDHMNNECTDGGDFDDETQTRGDDDIIIILDEDGNVVDPDEDDEDLGDDNDNVVDPDEDDDDLQEEKGK